MYGFLLVFFSNFVPKTHRFWDIRLVSIPWPWNPGLGSLKVIENYTTRSGTYDFLLKFHSRPNHRPISHCFRDKRRYPSKIANFPTPRVFNAPLKGFPLNCVTTQGSQETRMMRLWGGRKSFEIARFSRFDTIPACVGYPASHPTSQPRCRGKDTAYYVARVKSRPLLIFTIILFLQ